MKVGKLIDVSEKNVFLKSHNEENKVVKDKIIGIIKKEDSVEYKVFLSNNKGKKKYLFSGSQDHMIFAKPTKNSSYSYGWYSLTEIEENNWESIVALNHLNEEVYLLVEKTKNIIPIVDIQMENENYFSNGILSHNSGGTSLKYYSSVRIEISRTGDAKEGQEISGNKTKVKIIKNKMAPPKKVAEFEIKFGKGIDQDAEILDLAVQDNIVQKSGAWYKYEGESVGQGRDNSIVWLNDNPEIKEKIRKEILENRGL